MAQSPASPDPKPHARFPYVAAILCAACVGAAAWTWMRYSYAWAVTPAEVVAGEVPVGTLVDVVGTVCLDRRGLNRVPPSGLQLVGPVVLKGDGGKEVELLHTTKGKQVWPYPIRSDGETVLRGRIESHTTMVRLPRNLVLLRRPTLRLSASRFHGASIAGLVVGAMGAFVFTVALRYWLKERRRFRERTAGA